MKKEICRNCVFAIRHHSYRYDSDVKYYCDLQLSKRTKIKRKRIKANDIACEKYSQEQ